MNEYMKLSFIEFLEALKGTKEVYGGPNCTFIIPGSSTLDTIQVYNYLESITRSFDPEMVKLVLKSTNAYLRNLNNEYLELFGIDAFKLDQFVELIYILENKLENFKSIDQSGKVKILPKPFIEYLHYKDKTKLLSLLHSLLSYAETKDIAKYIFALRDLSYIEIPTPRTNLFRAMEVEFGKIGTNSGMNYYFADNLESQNRITSSEIKLAKELIENRLKD